MSDTVNWKLQRDLQELKSLREGMRDRGELPVLPPFEPYEAAGVGLPVGATTATSDTVDATDAKIAAAEARTDTKFAELRRDMDAFATRGTVWKGVASTIAAIVTAVGVILAVMAFGGDRFDAGVGAGGALAPYAEQQRARDAAQDRKYDEILRRLPPPDRARDR